MKNGIWTPRCWKLTLFRLHSLQHCGQKRNEGQLKTGYRTRAFSEVFRNPAGCFDGDERLPPAAHCKSFGDKYPQPPRYDTQFDWLNGIWPMPKSPWSWKITASLLNLWPEILPTYSSEPQPFFMGKAKPRIRKVDLLPSHAGRADCGLSKWAVLFRDWVENGQWRYRSFLKPRAFEAVGASGIRDELRKSWSSMII